VVVRSNRHAIESLASELGSAVYEPRVPESPRSKSAPAPVRAVELTGVSFQFSPGTPRVLDNVTLRIPAGTAIGIIGESGSGKTTLVDLIVGLIRPTSGRIEVDGENLDARRVPAWQQSIGYVPQDVMILDASVRENIAFGVAPGEIDDARVREVARQAGALEFIEALPGAFAAAAAGSGGGLSGGQRQRIAIARALYNEPALVVLDEATNSLDAETERAIIDTVVRNRGSRTVVVIAHGAAVIDACDRVYELRGGTLQDRGAPQEQAPAIVRKVR
jgi:ATP-binding cassette, subfamily B, bacterial PglK